MAVELRRRTLLPFDDALGCLHDGTLNLTRSSLRRCLARHGIPCLPESPGQRPSRTLKQAAIKAFHYPSPESLKAHVLAFVSACNFAERLEALRWRALFEAVCHA